MNMNISLNDLIDNLLKVYRRLMKALIIFQAKIEKTYFRNENWKIIL